jgi:hypothetical protein
MTVIGERQGTGGNGRNPSGSESIDKLWVWEVFSSMTSFGSGQIEVVYACGLCLSLWRITTGWYWPGVHRLPSQIASVRLGIGMPEIWGKLTFRPNFCYFATCEKNWPREEDPLGDFARLKRLQNLVGTEIAMDAA